VLARWPVKADSGAVGVQRLGDSEDNLTTAGTRT
jgi:hypothetical protein